MGYKEIQSNWWKATKVEDFLEGTLVNREWQNKTDLQGREVRHEVYEILADGGVYHNLIVDANGQKVIDSANPVAIEKGEYYKFAKSSVVDAMKKIKMGQKVKFLFFSTTPSKDKMKQAFKLVKVYAGDMDEEYLKSQWGEVSTSETESVKVEDIPFN